MIVTFVWFLSFGKYVNSTCPVCLKSLKFHTKMYIDVVKCSYQIQYVRTVFMIYFFLQHLYDLTKKIRTRLDSDPYIAQSGQAP